MEAYLEIQEVLRLELVRLELPEASLAMRAVALQELDFSAAAAHLAKITTRTRRAGPRAPLVVGSLA